MKLVYFHNLFMAKISHFEIDFQKLWRGISYCETWFRTLGCGILHYEIGSLYCDMGLYVHCETGS